MMRLIPDRLFLEGEAAKNHYMLFMKNRDPSQIFNFYSNYSTIGPFLVSLIFTIWLLPFSFLVSYGFLLWLVLHLAVSIFIYHGTGRYYAEFYETEQVFVFIEHTASINKWQYVIIERQDGDQICIANKFHSSSWGGDAIFDYRYSDNYHEYLHKFPEYFRKKIPVFCREFDIPISDVSGKVRYKPSSTKSIVISFSIAIIGYLAMFYFFEVA